MKHSKEKSEVFSDYAAFLHALLPQAQGFLFHDRHARLFWHDDTLDTRQLDSNYHDSLQRALELDEQTAESARVNLRDCVAYLVRLKSDRGKLLGVLTALVEPDMGRMPHRFCSDLLRPALRSLARELSLRVHLLDATRKITEHTSEHDFLLELGKCTRSESGCEASLQSVLELCIETLALDGAVLLAPDFRLHLRAGSRAVPSAQAELYLEDLPGHVDTQTSLSGCDLNLRAPHISLPLQDAAKRTTGVLVLSRMPDASQFNDSIRSMAPLILATIEHLLEKGFDSITGLMHWPAFEQQLDALCSAPEGEHSLMYLDLDQLQVANDSGGHAAGDQVLREFAAFLKSALPNHPMTRVTSDSFAVLLQDTTLDQARQVAESVCEQLGSGQQLRDVDAFRPSASIGVAALAGDEKDAAAALMPAQIACQAAKDRGRGRVEVYEASDVSIVRRMDDLNLVGSIKSAIEGGRLVLFAQPIVSLDGQNEFAYHELLVRMLSTSGEPVPPADFMGAAERYQLMQELDRWVVSKAIATLTAHPVDVEGRPFRFAVNLSGQSIGNEKFLEFVKDELTRTGLSPERLCLEITETVAISNLRRAQVFMHELRQLGCQFSLDDFGTGLSSFAYLKLFPVDKIKIDGSFVHDAAHNEVSRAMVAAITDIARVMQLQTVAEYVQDAATLETVSKLGVNWAQGFHLGAPVRLRELFSNATIIDKADLADVDPALLEQLPA